MAGYSGLYDGVYSEPYALLVSTNQRRPAQASMFRKLLNNKQMLPLRELLLELTGTAAGASASVTEKRIKGLDIDADVQDLGGLREIETRTLLSRVTTAADVTAIDALMVKKNRPSYVADKSGNGGAALA